MNTYPQIYQANLASWLTSLFYLNHPQPGLLKNIGNIVNLQVTLLSIDQGLWGYVSGNTVRASQNAEPDLYNIATTRIWNWVKKVHNGRFTMEYRSQADAIYFVVFAHIQSWDVRKEISQATVAHWNNFLIRWHLTDCKPIFTFGGKAKDLWLKINFLDHKMTKYFGRGVLHAECNRCIVKEKLENLFYCKRICLEW